MASGTSLKVDSLAAWHPLYKSLGVSIYSTFPSHRLSTLRHTSEDSKQPDIAVGVLGESG